MNTTYIFRILLVLLAATNTYGQEKNQYVDNNLLPTGRSITPAGSIETFYGRPVDMLVAKDLLVVKDHRQIKAFDVKTLKLQSSIEIDGGASLYGLACSRDGTIYASNSKHHIRVFKIVNGQLKKSGFIELPKDSFPCGICISKDEKLLYACLSKKNSVVEIDLAKQEVIAEISVGIAPFDCQLTPTHLVVSNIGGRRPAKEDLTAKSAGTDTVVDERGIANTGSVSVVSLAQKKVVAEIQTGLHPTVLETTQSEAIVCNSNEDSLSWVDIKNEKSKPLDIKPLKGLPFGSMPSCVQWIDHQYLLVTLAGNNALAVFERGSDDDLKLLGHIPTAWYPASIAHNKFDVFVGSVKGIGARAKRRPAEEGWNSHDHQGAVQKISIADFSSPEKMKTWSEQVQQNSQLPQILRNRLLTKPGSEIKAKPIPEKLGEPSLFKHVIYVIKENRTFDQVFGDYKEARSEPSLCIFPREKTPNHHALADRFGILDNYYCNGVLSADGHSWATEGNVTTYLERAFGGFSRSYTFGDDPITYSSSGFIWDHILGAGLSFRNYGELNYAKLPEGMNYQKIYEKYLAGEQTKFGHNIGIDRLRKYSCLDYPGWNMEIPDVLRMDRFLKEFRVFEKEGNLPNFCILYLPEDHLGAKGITSNAHMADNDLALGRLVEAVSNSGYWKDTVIFVNEDDPQNGFDHIDGHRSICLAISAYSKPGINHSFYNQTSVIRTILHIFGLPPMNQQDASAPLMKDCFVDVGNFNAYTAVTPKTKLNETTGKQSSWSPEEKKWRQILATVPIERTGMKSEQDEDKLNRFIWHEAKGWKTPYPTEFAGAHAKGLEKLGLSLDPHSDEE